MALIGLLVHYEKLCLNLSTDVLLIVRSPKGKGKESFEQRHLRFSRDLGDLLFLSPLPFKEKEMRGGRQTD